MPDDIHVSPAENLEDVVLARAFAEVPAPRALLVGAPSSRLAGALRGLLDAGWTCAFRTPGSPGVVEVDGPPLHAALLAEPTADAVDAAVAGGAWVVVVDSPLLGSEHDAWEEALTSAGYALRQADGLSRYYVAAAHDDLAEDLAYPAGPRDAYVTEEVVRLRRRVEELTAEVLRWRVAALERWATSERPVLADGRAEALERELAAVRQTLSWRVTAPLRAVRRRGARP